MDDSLYDNMQGERFVQYETSCVRCGQCCGAYDGDPCENLLLDIQGKYSCKVYERRSGLQKTLSGKSFNCVPIREPVRLELPYSRCPYIMGKRGLA